MIEVKITPELIVEMLTTGNEIHAKIVDGLPKGATLGDVYWRGIGDDIRLQFDCQGPHEKKFVTVRDLRREVDELREKLAQRLKD